MSFLVFLLLIIVVICFGMPFVKKGPVFAPSTKTAVKKMVELAEIKPQERAVDVGSGDGRLVIELGKAGARAYGIEVNPILVFWSRCKIKKNNMAQYCHILNANFWKEDFSSYNVVTFFGIIGVMGALEKKLQKELPKGARVVLNHFTFPTWKPAKKDGNLYLYIKE